MSIELYADIKAEALAKEREEFSRELWQKDETAAIAYEQLIIQQSMGMFTKPQIGELMREWFDVCPVPEDSV